jgi:hypothetical protein
MVPARRPWKLVFVAAMSAAALFPALSHRAAVRTAARRVDALSKALSGPAAEHRLRSTSLDPISQARLARLGPLLASWETVGGCGAGASTGTGGGIKWVGRNVTGGLFHVEQQGAYLHTDYGYNYISSTLITHDLDANWNVGVSVPYLYKFMRNPVGLGFDVVNQGPGDVALLGTRHFGAIRDWSSTLTIGLPTGTHDAYIRTPDNLLPQDRQLGLGPHSTTFVTASVLVDHTIDRDWGPTVLGGMANWRGGTNELKSTRVPNATVYAYSGYLLGPLVPALGVSMTGSAGHDVDRTMVQTTPLFSVAANASLEWSSDWVAVILGGSVPYGYTNSVGGLPPGWSLAPWTVALGIAVAPF